MELLKVVWPIAFTLVGSVWAIVFGIIKTKDKGEKRSECIISFERIEKNADSQWKNIHHINKRTQEIEIELVTLKGDIKHIKDTVDKTHEVIIKNGGKK